MKPLLPTLKEKKRYIVYEVQTKDPLQKDVSRAILRELQTLLGVFDGASAGVNSTSYDNKTQRGVLRISVKGSDKVRAALAMIKQIEETKVRIVTLGISGILKKTQPFLEGKKQVTINK